MAIVILTGVVFGWYYVKALRENPNKPNWSKAIAATMLWPFSAFMKRYN